MDFDLVPLARVRLKGKQNTGGSTFYLHSTVLRAKRILFILRFLYTGLLTTTSPPSGAPDDDSLAQVWLVQEEDSRSCGRLSDSAGPADAVTEGTAAAT